MRAIIVSERSETTAACDMMERRGVRVERLIDQSLGKDERQCLFLSDEVVMRGHEGSCHEGSYHEVMQRNGAERNGMEWNGAEQNASSFSLGMEWNGNGTGTERDGGGRGPDRP